MSIPRALLLVLALLQATGIADAMRRQACDRDGCGDDCTPGNDAPSCPCHCPSTITHAPPVVGVVALGTPTVAILTSFRDADTVHLDPDPREILHVPRRAV